MLVKKTGITQCLKCKYENLKRCTKSTSCIDQAETDVDTESNTNNINQGEYEPLLPITEHTTVEPTENKNSVNGEQITMTPVHTYMARLTNSYMHHYL